MVKYTREQFIELANQIKDLQTSMPDVYLEFLSTILNETDVKIYHDTKKTSLCDETRICSIPLKKVNSLQYLHALNTTAKQISDSIVVLSNHADIVDNDDIRKVYESLERQAQELTHLTEDLLECFSKK